MHYFSNKFFKNRQFKNRPLNFSDLKFRDLAKLRFFKLIMTKSNFKNQLLTSLPLRHQKTSQK